jgi:hypothetical protein
MPAPIYVGVASGGTVSSAFTLGRADRAMVLLVPSLTATSVFLQFSQTSGASPWHDHARTDGSGALHAIYSGTGPRAGYLEHPPTAWGRLRLAAAAGEPSSFAILTRW